MSIVNWRALMEKCIFASLPYSSTFLVHPAPDRAYHFGLQKDNQMIILICSRLYFGLCKGLISCAAASSECKAWSLVDSTTCDTFLSGTQWVHVIIPQHQYVISRLAVGWARTEEITPPSAHTANIYWWVLMDPKNPDFSSISLRERKHTNIHLRITRNEIFLTAESLP